MSAPEPLAAGPRARSSPQHRPSSGCRRVSAAVFRDGEVVWQEALGLADVESGARGDARHPVPDRLDHEDVHRRRRSCSSATRASSSLDDPLTQHSPEARTAPDDRPDARARLRAPARAARRDLGDDEGAQPRGAARRHSPTPSRCSQPGRGGTTRTSPSRCSARSSRARTAARGSDALQDRILDPLGLVADDARRRADPAARGYFVEPVLGRAPAGADLDLGGAGALGQLWSTTGDLARWGVIPRRRATTACSTQRRSRRCRTCGDGRPRRAGRSAGARARALPLAASISSSATAARCRASSRVSSSTAKTKIGAVVLTNTGAGAGPEKLALDLAVAAIEALPGRDRGVAAGREAAGRARAAARPLVDGGARDRLLLAQGAARGRARRRRPGPERLVSSSRRATTAGASPRAASAASCCASCATPTARSRSSTSPRTRCAASPSTASESGRRRRRRATATPT